MKNLFNKRFQLKRRHVLKASKAMDRGCMKRADGQIMAVRPGYILVNGSIGIRQYAATSRAEAIRAYQREVLASLDEVLFYSV